MYKLKTIRGLILLGLFILPAVGIFTGEARAGEESEEDIIRVQGLVMNFADSYASNMLQSNTVFQQQFSDMTARTNFMQMTLYSMSSAYDIASGPYARRSLVDMVVLVTLQRIVWEEHWQPNVYGSKASFHLEIIQQLEKDIWSIAGRELSREQLKVLMDLIQAWHKAHPEQDIVVSIRFTDFGSLGEIFRLAESKGLFSNISKAVDTADEIRQMGDRFRYQISRMQLLLNYQLELAYMQLAAKPEMAALMKDSAKLAAAADQFARVTDNLPEMTKNIFDQLEKENDRLRSLLEMLNQTLGTGDELTVKINRTVASLDSLVSRFDPIRAKDGAKPINVEQFSGLARDLSETGRQFNDLLQTADHFLSDQDREKRLVNLVESLANIERRGEELIDLIFYRSLAVILIALFGVFFLAIAYNYISNKFLDTRKRKPVSD